MDRVCNAGVKTKNFGLSFVNTVLVWVNMFRLSTIFESIVSKKKTSTYNEYLNAN